MSDNEKSGSHGVSGCFSAILLIIVIGLSLNIGPFDAWRTIYNSILGDVPVIKKQILKYSRTQIKKQYPTVSSDLVEAILATRLQLPINKNEKISSDMVSIFELWELVEVYPQSWKDKWIWVTLE